MRVTVPVTIDVGTPTSCVPDPLATVKSQRMRLVDVLVVGPLMVWGGVKAGGWGGAALAVSGLATMAYNARDYSRVRTLASPAPQAAPALDPVA